METTSIEASKKLMDLPFVSRVIRSGQLNPVPLAGFYQDPSAWNESPEWKRTVERYDWGVVLFLSNLKSAEHFTVVAKGTFDVATGVVTDSSGARRAIPVPWYKEMARDLGGMQVQSPQIVIPPCLGNHVDDAGTEEPICDGGTIPSKGIEEKPCAWRDRCIPFQMHCARIKRLPQEVLTGLSLERIVQLTTRLREEAQSNGGDAVATPAPKAIPTPRQTAKVPQAAAPAGQKVQHQNAGHALFWQIHDGLKARAKSRRFLPNREGAEPGDIFIEDRSDPSGYISLYCEPSGGRRIAIVEVRIKVDRVHVLFPIEASSPLLKGTGALPAKDGKFISIVSNVPKALPVAKVCDILAKAIDSNAIDLPARG